MALWKRQKKERAGSPPVFLPADGSALLQRTPVTMFMTQLSTSSAAKAWQHLLSNQQMGEFQKGTLVFLSFHKQHATHGLSTKSTTVPITHTHLVNWFGLDFSNQIQLRLTE